VKIKNWSRFQHQIRYGRVPWIKLYRDLLDDPDWHSILGDDAKILVMLWLVASEDIEGNLPTVERLAFRLRISKAKFEQALGRLDHWVISDGYPTDIQRVHEREKEREKERKKDPAINRGPASKSYIGDWVPSSSLTEKGKEEFEKMKDWSLSNGIRKASWPATWRNWQKRAGGGCELSEANPSPDIGYYAEFGSAEQEAWDAHGRQHKGMNYPRDKRGGWTFPSRWPPADALPCALAK
jgi:hypothetical protein